MFIQRSLIARTHKILCQSAMKDATKHTTMDNAHTNIYISFLAEFFKPIVTILLLNKHSPSLPSSHSAQPHVIIT